MSETPGRDPFEAGRTDAAAPLQDRLATAPPRYVEGALQNPAFNEGLLEVALRNAGLPGELLARIANDERFRRSDPIKRALVMHPATPPALSMQYVKFLVWRDLLLVADDKKLVAPVRALAEQLVAERLSQLPPAEKARLARNASRAIVAAFLRSRNAQVIQELMSNPRLSENDVLALARDPTMPTTVLSTIARHGQWGRRYSVRITLLENISTPVHEAVKLVPGLLQNDLRNLVKGSRTPGPVRQEAEKQLKAKLKGG